MSNICFPNAKINIGLNVTAKRPDGYHDLETVFYPVELCDMLEFVPSPVLKFSNSGLVVDGDFRTNLVVKAWELLASNHDISPITIHLHKIIPFGAGLGGGSADAAFMLVALNDWFKLGLTESLLETYAAQLGSDCAFFVRNKPSFATGRGEILEHVNLDLSMYNMVIVNPGIHIPTREAFASIVPAKPIVSLKDIISTSVSEWKHSIFNDFEKSIFPKYPAIKHVKQKLYDLGAEYAAMTGSGASVYGIFKERVDLQSQFPGYFVWRSNR